MHIPPEEVRRIAALASLEIDQEEIRNLSHDLSRILNYFDQLKEVDTEEISPLVQILKHRGRRRPDKPGRCLPVEVALQNAPERSEHFFKVPRVIK